MFQQILCEDCAEEMEETPSHEQGAMDDEVAVRQNAISPKSRMSNTMEKGLDDEFEWYELVVIVIYGCVSLILQYRHFRIGITW